MEFFAPITDNLDRFLDGALLTLKLTLISSVVGLIFAVPLALGRLSYNPFVKWPIFGYMFYFRGTPLLVQLFLVYYGSGQFSQELRAIGLWDGFFREAHFCALLTLMLNTAAYTAEILRGAILGVPHGEVEAARAVGMSRILMLRRVILPRAFRIALPAYTNEFVFLFQATSLVSVITLLDLTGIARDVISDTFRSYTVWIFVGVVYCAISYFFFYVFRKLEFYWSGHLRARPGMDVAKPKKGAAAGAKDAPAIVTR
jgi:octopine/nopaline transport system permease protein/arginine/ornithine transport system permease protein